MTGRYFVCHFERMREIFPRWCNALGVKLHHYREPSESIGASGTSDTEEAYRIIRDITPKKPTSAPSCQGSSQSRNPRVTNNVNNWTISSPRHLQSAHSKKKVERKVTQAPAYEIDTTISHRIISVAMKWLRSPPSKVLCMDKLSNEEPGIPK